MAGPPPLVLSSSRLKPAKSESGAEKWRLEATKALRATFGFDSFRGQQLDAIVAALSGRDAFVLMPTGGGKSMCYALVPAVKRGLVLVVSPLIALMQDQVQAFRGRGLRADFLSSTRSEADRRRLLQDMQQPQPDTQLLFVTPELLGTESFMRCLRVAYTSGGLLLLAVDEAHCISGWGHDFRHSYRKLWSVRQELPRLPIMALTATASERVQQDIVQQLRLRDPLLLRASFNRPNIRYEVRYVELLRGPGGQPMQSPLQDIIALLEGGAGQQQGQKQEEQQGQQHGDQQAQQGGQQAQQAQRQVPCTVIYCMRREEVDRVAGTLRRRGIACAAYHAGLPDAMRAQVLRDWQAERLSVVVATVAFGMGIDRAGVRYVLHYSLPKSLEAFYQESGRAGRDGQPSHSILYYSTEDRQKQEFVLGQEKGKGQKYQQQGEGSHPNQLQQFGQVVDYCLSARCRRSGVLAHFGERLVPPPADTCAAAACCDVCCDGGGTVAAALRQLASAGAQRRQQFAGGKHALDFGAAWGSGGRAGGSGVDAGGAGTLEFERSWAHEGLDYDQEGPNRALQESDDEGEGDHGQEEPDAIQPSSDDGDDDGGGEEDRAAAAAAMRRARRASHDDGSDSEVGMLAAMERAEQRFQQQQGAGGSKRARLLHKLEGGGTVGGSGGSSRSPPGGSGSSSQSVTDAQRQAATRQLAAALSGNAALANDVTNSGMGAAAVAAALEQQLAAGNPSKPVWQSKVANLVMQLKKARGMHDTPALAAVLASSAAAGSGNTPAAATAASAAPSLLSAEQLQQRVSEAAALATEAAGLAAQGSGPGLAPAVAAATAALQSLASAPVTQDLLQRTGAGKQVGRLKKHEVAAVAQAAAAVVQAWRARVLAAGPS